MKKEKIFSKFNKTNFNDELEEILGGKPFSENVKNNILNMIYKIEEAYNDYSIVKKEVVDEKEFLENILISIKNYCNNIEISNSDEMRTKKYIIDYEKGSIKVISNYYWMLYAILDILKAKKNYQNELDIMQNKPIYEFLKIGYNINNTEVIRDFNGWSWINSLDEVGNFKANLVYQNLQFLLGIKNMENFMKNTIVKENDIISQLKTKLERYYGKELSNKIINKLKEISITEIANIDKEYKKVLVEIKNRKQEEFNLMENKKDYLKEITYIKKTNNEIIKGIDKTINNKELLQIEYKLRNSMLKNNEKIFSISYLVDILNNERKEALDKIAEINTLMEPKNYIQKKEELRSIINQLSLNEQDIYESLVELQKLFVEGLLKRVEYATEKVDIINFLYKIRYYINISFLKDTHIKDAQELKEKTALLREKIVEKLIKNKLVFEFSDNDDLNKKIVNSVLDTRIINLQKIYIILKKDKENVKIEIYDEDELYRIENIEIENIKDKNLKLDKKMKLFT